MRRVVILAVLLVVVVGLVPVLAMAAHSCDGPCAVPCALATPPGLVAIQVTSPAAIAVAGGVPPAPVRLAELPPRPLPPTL